VQGIGEGISLELVSVAATSLANTIQRTRGRKAREKEEEKWLLTVRLSAKRIEQRRGGDEAMVAGVHEEDGGGGDDSKQALVRSAPGRRR
jgi:hypothetical protein